MGCVPRNEMSRVVSSKAQKLHRRVVETFGVHGPSSSAQLRATHESCMVEIFESRTWPKAAWLIVCNAKDGCTIKGRRALSNAERSKLYYQELSLSSSTSPLPYPILISTSVSELSTRCRWPVNSLVGWPAYLCLPLAAPSLFCSR